MSLFEFFRTLYGDDQFGRILVGVGNNVILFLLILLFGGSVVIVDLIEKKQAHEIEMKKLEKK